MDYIVVGYYTKNTGYAEEVKHLVASLNRFNLPMDITEVPTQGSWQANTQYKAYFIKHMLLRHYPKSVLYLDADARVQQYPSLFDSVDFDLGIMYKDNIELVSSTLYFSNNAKVFELVDRWIGSCLANPQVWDQKVLQYVLENDAEDLSLNVMRLPPTYCQIFDLMKDAGDPVIEQFQASRRFKQEIDK